jgi:uncharacterized RDD family membrane protein YckC
MDYGGFWIRFLAYLVDSLIVVIAFVVINALLGLMGLELAGGQIVLLVLGILYYAFMQASPRQATLGKALVGLKVGGIEGERIGFGRALAREVAKLLSALTFLIGFIIAGFTKRKQALHDLIASTCVVRAEPGRVMAALSLSVVALVAPFVAAVILGAEVVASTMGVTLPGPDVAMQAPPEPAPKPAAPAPKPAAAVAAPAPAVAPALAVASQLTPAPTPVAAPAEKPVVIPAATPVILAQATEAPKPAPVPAEPPKVVEAPKPAPDAPPAPRADQIPPPAVPRVIPGPTIPAPKYNDLVTAVIYGDPKTVEQLLALGKWPDKPDRRGVTALMSAALLGDRVSAEVLLKAGANPNRPGPGGDTATSIAREREDPAMVGLLQRYGGK